MSGTSLYHLYSWTVGVFIFILKTRRFCFSNWESVKSIVFDQLSRSVKCFFFVVIQRVKTERNKKKYKYYKVKCVRVFTTSIIIQLHGKNDAEMVWYDEIDGHWLNFHQIWNLHELLKKHIRVDSIITCLCNFQKHFYLITN